MDIYEFCMRHDELLIYADWKKRRGYGGLVPPRENEDSFMTLWETGRHHPKKCLFRTEVNAHRKIEADLGRKAHETEKAYSRQKELVRLANDAADARQERLIKALQDMKLK